MKSILFLMLSISLLTISCTENTVNIEMQYSPQIIVEGYLRNNQPITIRLSLSKAPDVPFEMFPLVNAKISLFENDIFIDTMMMIDSGVYRINWFPKNKCIYRIEINYKNYPKITAQTFIDDSVKLSVKKVLTQYKGQQSLQFKCQVLDNQQNRFYGIGFYEKTLWKQFCSDPFYTDTFYAGLPINENEIPKFVEFVSVTDRLIDGAHFELADPSSIQSVRMLFFNRKTMVNNYFEVYMQQFTVNTVLLYSMSPEVYEFYRSIAVLSKQTESSLTVPFYNISAIKSNIINGLGIFGYIFTYEFPVDSVRTICF